jgi:hypothetical protein
MPSRFLRVRTAAVAGLATLSIGGVAVAATGLTSSSAERAAGAASSRTSGGQAAHAQGAAEAKAHDPNAAAATGRSADDKASDHAAGPDASGAARHGLCQAWSAGQGDDHGRRMDAPAFQALAAAAGGADQVPAYCEAELEASAQQGQSPATPPGDAPVKPSPPTTGPPEDPGQGQGQGGPPTTS